MQITQYIRKWGNGRAVRLPKKMLDAAKLHTGHELVINQQGRSIVITPASDDYNKTLDELLDGVTPHAVGGEVLWGIDHGLEKYD